MFGRLADPEGHNNALSQVLYGLALRSVSLLTTGQTSTSKIKTLQNDGGELEY